MEIRARYVQMGAFTLAVIVAGFAFVYWLNNAGGLRERAVYRVRFESSVSGLLKGSAVLFNGIRVGEVTALELDADNPRQVHGDDRHRPQHAGARGHRGRHRLPGPDGIARRSRSRAAPRTEPLAAAKGEPPVLVADPAAGQSMSQAAREVLRRLDARARRERRAAAQA